jgi:quinol monooxygenase YgiN
MKKVLYAQFTARPDTVDRVDELIRGLAEDVRREPGNEVFAVYREESDPLRFFVFEVYRDDQAFQAHITADYGATFNAELVTLIEEDGSQLTWLTPVGDVELTQS